MPATGRSESRWSSLPDVYVPCEVCKGARYNRDTLDILFKGLTITDVLNLPCRRWSSSGTSRRSLAICKKRWWMWGWAMCGSVSQRPRSRAAAQRVKLASELAKRSTGHTIYLLDEPTTDYHISTFASCSASTPGWWIRATRCWSLNTTWTSSRPTDWIIDMGPEGGSGGGRVVVEGPPEVVTEPPRALRASFWLRCSKRRKNGNPQQDGDHRKGYGRADLVDPGQHHFDPNEQDCAQPFC